MRLRIFTTRKWRRILAAVAGAKTITDNGEVVTDGGEVVVDNT